MGATGQYLGVVQSGALARLPVELDAKEACAEDGANIGARWIQVLPFGQDVEARDGRRFTVADAHEVVRNTELPMLVDREHLSETDGDSIAAGWIEELEVRDGKGVFGRVNWTPAARQQVQSQEYRFLSPVVLGKRKDGRFHVQRLSSVALTNRPALKMAGIEMFRERLSHRFGPFTAEEPQMDKLKKAICTALGLEDNADDDTIATAAVARLNQQRGGDESASLRVVVDTLTKERNEATEALTAARKELDGFKAVSFKREVEVFFDQGAREGRIPPAARDKWLAFAMESADQFKMFREIIFPGLPKLAPTDRASLTKRPGKGAKLKGRSANGVDYEALKKLGLTDDQIRESESEVFTKERDPWAIDNGPGDEDDEDEDDSEGDGAGAGASQGAG